MLEALSTPARPAGDLAAAARAIAFLSAKAGSPLSPERLLASLSDGHGVAGTFDVPGIAAALQQAGLVLERMETPLAELASKHLPAFLYDPEGEYRVMALSSRGLGRGIEARTFDEGPEAGRDLPLGVFALAYPGTLWRIAPLSKASRLAADGEPDVREHWFWSVFRRELGTYGSVVGAAVIINILGLVSSLYTMTVYDRVIPNNAMVTLWTLSIGVGVVYFFDLIFRSLRGHLIDIAARRVDVLVSRDLFEQVLGIRLEHRPTGAGALASILKEFGTVQEFFSSATLLAIVDLPFVFLYLAVMFAIAPMCAWATALAIPLVLLIGALIQFRLSTTSKDAYKDGQDKHGVLVETLIGLEAIRGLGAERTMRRRWRDAVASSAISSGRVRFFTLLAVNLGVSVQQLAGLVVVVVGVLGIQQGQLTMGALVASVILSGRALAPLAQIAQILARYNLTRASMNAITRYMAIPTERPDGRRFLDRPKLVGSLSLEGVGFAYGGKDPVPVLRDLDLQIRPGERVGVLGRVGCGKSTLLKLLMGMMQPSAGRISIDGVELRQLDPAQLRAQVAYVPQSPLLFSGTVRENLAIARPEATDAEILRAAVVAGVDDFVRLHPMGYDRVLAERGEGLSTGQRQAIAIAQALVKDAHVLLMDEPTSAMDDRTEGEFRARLASWVTGKTLVVVTHKLSILELVDRVIVVDGGRVVLDGQRDAVLRRLQGIDMASAQKQA